MSKDRPKVFWLTLWEGLYPMAIFSGLIYLWIVVSASNGIPFFFKIIFDIFVVMFFISFMAKIIYLGDENARR